MKITIIGAGNMGGAIAKGLAKGSIFSENEITCTALASCGIAFAMRYIHASAQGGVEIGVKAADAQKIVEHTMIGAAKLLLAKNAHPATEIDKVTTPGGITIRGLNEMEHAGFTSAVIKGLKACVK